MMECTVPESEQSCKTEAGLSDVVNLIPDGLNNSVSDTKTTKESNCNASEAVTVAPSKKQLKRERRLQNRLKMKAEWKLQRKLKRLKSKERRKMEKQNVTPSNSSNEIKLKLKEMAESTNKFRVVIDFSYDELMSPKDLTKCGNQVVRCYSANRRSSNPLQLYFCNFGGKIKEEMSKNYEYKKWDINFNESTYLDVFSKEQLVYLTSESRNVLETLDENKVYIIGGLVDHNFHKGVSYRKAVLEGISHAQLPIRKNIQMKTRSVLTINHVFEILLKVSNGDSWTTALRNSIPPRFLETLNPGVEKEDASGVASSSGQDEKTNSEMITDSPIENQRTCDIFVNEKGALEAATSLGLGEKSQPENCVEMMTEDVNESQRRTQDTDINFADKT